MQMIEQHAIDQTNPRLAIIDEAASSQKSLQRCFIPHSSDPYLSGALSQLQRVQNPSVA
jgi:hypothetical protein